MCFHGIYKDTLCVHGHVVIISLTSLDSKLHDEVGGGVAWLTDVAH